MTINYITDDNDLTVDQFLALVDRVWPGDYDREKTAAAIARTLNVTAWDGERLLYEQWRGEELPGRLHPPQDTPYGLREFARVDPDGNLLRVDSPLDVD